MHFGDSHTKEPKKWLEKFEKKYKILSVVLIVGFDECIKNAVCRQEHPLTPSDAIHQYFLFYTEHHILRAFFPNRFADICVGNKVFYRYELLH